MNDHSAFGAPRGNTAPSTRVALLALTVFGATACTNSDDLNDQVRPGTLPPPITVLDRAETLGFGQFAALARASSFETLLEGNQNVTVFAPSDAAFADVPVADLLALLEPAALAELDEFVAYHITMGALDPTDLEGLEQIATVGSEDAYVDHFGANLFINDAEIVSGDAQADNGQFYGLDRILDAPRPTLETLELRGFDTLVELIELSGLAGALNGGQFTLMCPTDAAFDALPASELAFLRDPANQSELQARLQLHIIGGTQSASALIESTYAQTLADSFLFFNRPSTGIPAANDTSFEGLNIRCTDGVLHTVGSVFERLPSLGQQASAEGLLTMTSLAFAGGIDTELQSLAPLTVFGPTDTAIEDGLAPGVIDDLVDPGNLPRLQRFLRAHMVEAPLSYRALLPGSMLTAVSGDVIDVTESDMGETTLNGMISLTVRNVYGHNGVLHVIDGLLDDGQ